jgi:hypothetical protein
MRAYNKRVRLLLTLVVAVTMILATFSSFGLADGEGEINTQCCPDPEQYTVIIQKQIDGNHSLEGFEFELWLDSAIAKEAVITNTSGQAIFTNVAIGTYDVVENLTT